MLDVLRFLWAQGAQNQTATIRRQIELANQVALFGAIATVPYQFFYAIADFRLYYPVFLANLCFIAGYLLVVAVNRAGKHWQASTVLLVNAGLQIFVVTSQISASAGFTCSTSLWHLWRYSSFTGPGFQCMWPL